ncbi:MAG: nuclear transport factor 2 family protein [Proteobacteria bacterium]|nr:nuclear transport factor 2 family protein [Pseudomonadota bacterium]
MQADEFLKTYERLTNTHEFDRVQPLIDDKAVFWFSSGSYCGLPAIQKAFENTWQLIQEEVYRIEDVACISKSETSAVYVYTYHWEGKINGLFAQGSGRGTSVIVKRAETWKVIHEHLSLFPKTTTS